MHLAMRAFHVQLHGIEGGADADDVFPANALAQRNTASSLDGWDERASRLHAQTGKCASAPSNSAANAPLTGQRPGQAAVPSKGMVRQTIQGMPQVVIDRAPGRARCIAE